MNAAKYAALDMHPATTAAHGQPAARTIGERSRARSGALYVNVERHAPESTPRKQRSCSDGSRVTERHSTSRSTPECQLRLHDILR
jgi:hypothetical protein